MNNFQRTYVSFIGNFLGKLALIATAEREQIFHENNIFQWGELQPIEYEYLVDEIPCKKELLYHLNLCNGSVSVYDTEDPEIVIIEQETYSDCCYTIFVYLALRSSFDFDPAVPVKMFGEKLKEAVKI